MAEKSGRAKASEKTGAKTAGTKATAKSPKTKARSVPSTAKGAKTPKKKTSFTLSAPEAQQVFVAGCFNDWDPTANPLEREEDGTWTCSLVLEPGEHEYRFVVDGCWWDDPLAVERRPNDFGCENCVVVV